MNRLFTKDATGIAPNGRWYAGDINALQDAVAALTDLTQTLSLGTLKIGETGLQLLRYGTLEARITGAFRTDGIIRALGGLYAGAFTTTQRDAIAAGSRPYGLVILNTTTNRYEWNNGSDASPTWVALGAPLDSPAFTGTPTAPTVAGTTDSTTKIATTAFVQAVVAAATAMGINAQTVAYHPVLSDAGKLITINSVGAVALTIDPDSTTNFAVGTVIAVAQLGAGQVTVTPGVGVTLYDNPGAKLSGQYAEATLVKIAANTWLLSGNLVP